MLVLGAQKPDTPIFFLIRHLGKCIMKAQEETFVPLVLQTALECPQQALRRKASHRCHLPELAPFQEHPRSSEPYLKNAKPGPLVRTKKTAPPFAGRNDKEASVISHTTAREGEKRKI
jgi:hypothetical protein